MKRVWQSMVLAVATLAGSGRAATVTDTRQYIHPDTQTVVVAGQLLLPGKGLWQLDEGTPVRGGLRHAMLQAPPEAIADSGSQRLSQQHLRNLPNRGRNPLFGMYRQAVAHARAHNGVPPRTVAELTAATEQKWIAQQFAGNPYGSEVGSKPGPHYAILPDVTFDLPEPGKGQDRATNRVPYIVELHPVFADGRHWVLYADRHVERVEIDRELMAKHGLAIDPYLPDPAAPPAPRPEQLVYQVYGALLAPDSCAFAVVNMTTGAREECTWETGTATEGDEAMATEWATLRVQKWSQYIAPEIDAPILRHWGRIVMAQYGAKPPEAPDRRRGPDDATSSAFGVLGGRAAMRETLQMQLLRVAGENDGEGVPVAGIAGVEVKSHPFREMLGDQPGGRLAIADAVPLDRFALFVRKPGALVPLLGQGGAFLARLGANATGHSLRYDLEGRYLRRLGLDRAWLEQFLQSGLVTEMALVLPDLFVVDGTEVTAISRAPQAALLAPLLALAGVRDLGSGRVAEVRLRDGGSCFWCIADDLVFAGTSREEIDRALGARTGKIPSLGQSDEFRYMLTKLAPTERTRMFAYFSDPFIRRLVGPEVKIGQLRRIQEKGRLEALTAAALLLRADGHGEPPTMGLLREGGYLLDRIDWGGVSLDGEGRAVSTTYGRLDGLASVSSRPILLATAAEAEAYKQYVQSYSRFWRRFFDPIAVRLDDTEDGGLAVETFILPLLDNSMYNGLRQMVESEGLEVPRLEPAPVLLASLRLSEKVWTDMLGDMFRRRGGPPALSAALDQLGPAVHVALHDSDPIIAFGSGDMLGLGTQFRSGRNKEMIAVPLFVSLLTRPLTIAVELKDPRPVRTFLETGAIRTLVPWQRELAAGASWYRAGDGDAWVLGIGVFGIGIRFGFEIQDNYLLISNLPWMERTRVAGTEPAALGALELRLRPDLVEDQLAAMFTAAHERHRAAALAGMAYVLPFVEAGFAMDQVGTEHRRRLGFEPLHPAPGEWTVQDGQLTSSMYGSPSRPRQPRYEKGAGPFGMLQSVADLRLALQLEDDGLRTRVRWTFHQ